MRELLPFISRIKGEGETGSITMTLKREEDCNVMCAKKKKKKKKRRKEKLKHYDGIYALILVVLLASSI